MTDRDFGVFTAFPTRMPSFQQFAIWSFSICSKVVITDVSNTASVQTEDVHNGMF